MVLDRERQMPFTRLWCLFEMGSTPSDKLTLVTQGFAERDLSAAFSSIDVGSADCFDPSARDFIRGEIALQHGSISAFTEFLRLRFLLRPLRYDLDVAELLRRKATDRFDFVPLREWVFSSPAATEMERDLSETGFATVGVSEASGRGFLACVAGVSGEGKSTAAAALVSEAAGPGGWVHAAHFCKHSDARTRDPVLIAKSLAYQLARRFTPVAVRTARTRKMPPPPATQQPSSHQPLGARVPNTVSIALPSSPQPTGGASGARPGRRRLAAAR